MAGISPSGSTKASGADAPKLKEINLAPQGDIILITGSPPAFKIKVSFFRLSEASPVFKRMFSGSFAEGQVKRSAEHSQELQLPEDDAQSIADICHLIYPKFDDLLGTSLTAERLFHLVAAADKYDCVDHLRLQVRSLMQTHFDHLGRREWKNSVLRAAAAYLLGNTRYFRKATNNLITHFNDPLSGIRKLPGGDIIPMSALLAMADKCAEAQRVASYQLGEGNIDCECGCGIEYFREDLLASFQVYDWPPRFEPGGKTIAFLLERMKAEKFLCCDRDCAYGGKSSPGRFDLLEVAEEVEGICKGLCVECAMEERVELDEGSCKHKDKGEKKPTSHTA